MNREPIYQALFAKLSSINGFLTKSRRLQHWSDVPAGAQPALFQAQKSENAVKVRGIPTKWTVDLHLYIYAYSTDANASPSTILNPLVDAIENALAPDSTGNQTLGGLVSHCSIIGNIETDEGVLGSQAVAIIPIQIVTT